jgi:hypothetical protein
VRAQVKRTQTATKDKGWFAERNRANRMLCWLDETLPPFSEEKAEEIEAYFAEQLAEAVAAATPAVTEPEDFNGCNTGDCPHWQEFECSAEAWLDGFTCASDGFDRDDLKEAFVAGWKAKVSRPDYQLNLDNSERKNK